MNEKDLQPQVFTKEEEARRQIMLAPMTQRTIDQLVEKGKQRADWFEPDAEVILASTAKMLLNQLDEQRRQADERLREVVGEIQAVNEENLKDLNDGVYGKFPANEKVLIAFNRLKTIAAKHNIDITPNTPQV